MALFPVKSHGIPNQDLVWGSGDIMFLSSVTHNLDTKGRVSIPADFRASVDVQTFDGVIVWPSGNGKFLEGAGIELMQDYQNSLNQLAHYDPRRLAVQKLIFARSKRLSFDGSGRITLPKEFVDYAGLGKKVLLAGVGTRFEIWNPEGYEAHLEAILKEAPQHQDVLLPVQGGLS